jgi:hypothetical protein
MGYDGGDLAHTEAPTRAAEESGKAHADAPIPTFRDAARKMLTEWQSALERVSLEYSDRFDAIDTAQAETVARLGLVEERLLAVELRIPPQPPRQ